MAHRRSISLHPPPAGIKPTSDSTKPSTELECAAIKLVCEISSYPPPIANPEGQDTTGNFACWSW